MKRSRTGLFFADCLRKITKHMPNIDSDDAPYWVQGALIVGGAGAVIIGACVPEVDEGLWVGTVMILSTMMCDPEL